MNDFVKFNLNEKLNKSLKNINFKIPTPIQFESIPLVLEGRDILGSAQTGTGKTHTMTGLKDPDQMGIMPRAFQDVFRQIEADSEQTQFLIRASYLEIYNEEVRDLLSKNPKNKLDLHETPDKGVYVKDLSFFAVKNVNEINDVMKIGTKNRSTASTNMNDTSSRSHSLF